MKYIKHYEEMSFNGIKKGVASAALAASLACNMTSCKVPDNAETLRIDQPDYSKHKNAFYPGDEINIEIPSNSHVKSYTISIMNSDNVELYQTSGKLEGTSGASIYWVIPSKYKDAFLKIKLSGKNKVNKEFDSITRTINISH